MTKRLRILHCLRAPVGGLFRHVLDLSIEQSARGHEVGIIADSTTSDRLTEDRFTSAAPHLKLGITRIPMSRLPGLGDLGACLAVRAAASRLDVDVLHGHGAKGGAYARLAARLLRFKGKRVATFYTPHGGSLHYASGSARAAAFIGLERILARFTDGLIFESDYARRTFENRIGGGFAQARVIANGLQQQDFAAQAPAPDAADFLFIGELRRLKGVDVLLQALAKVAQARPVRAVIVGSGPDREEFESLARELGLERIAVFAGAMPAAGAFAKGRCIVVPSRAESLPYIVLESAAAAVPLLATNVGGIPEIAAGSDTRLLPPGDVAALASAMHAFLDAPEAAKARARRLKDVVAGRFSVEAMTSAVLDFYAARTRS